MRTWILVLLNSAEDSTSYPSSSSHCLALHPTHHRHTVYFIGDSDGVNKTFEPP